jgi:RNA polymerase sigma-70 factor (ECF subfamily)
MEHVHSDSNTPENRDGFLLLFTRNQSRIYGYIVSLVGNLSDSDDLFQEAASVMWHNFDKYQEGTDFAAWGIRIARNKVIDYIRKSKQSRVFYSDETLELISDYRHRESQTRERRVKALEDCLLKLPAKDQDLLRMRYSQHTTTKSLAERFGRSVDGLYKTFSRIHFVLYRCIQQELEKA